jgi:hypothetical protein
MKTPKTPKPTKSRKPANRRVRLLRSKLEALAAVGIGGEKTNAQAKLDKLLARYDFTAPAIEIKDMFRGTFTPSPVARYLVAFDRADQDIAAAMKWAIENATQLQATFRGDQVWVEADTACLPTLANIALRIREGCRALWDRFATVPGVLPADRALFLRGIYDGMMNDGRAAGERLPARHVPSVRPTRTRKNALAAAPGLRVHPYTLALDLGRQLRFEAPVTDILGSLESAVGERKQLA